MLAIFLIPFTFCSYNLITKIQQHHYLAQQIKKATVQKDQLNTNNQKLKKKIQFYQSKEGIEQTIRTQIHYQKPNEILYDLPIKDAN